MGFVPLKCYSLEVPQIQGKYLQILLCNLASHKISNSNCLYFQCEEIFHYFSKVHFSSLDTFSSSFWKFSLYVIDPGPLNFLNDYAKKLNNPHNCLRTKNQWRFVHLLPLLAQLLVQLLHLKQTKHIMDWKWGGKVFCWG